MTTLVLSCSADAQTAAPPPTPAPGEAPAASAEPQRIEITGGRESDTEQRRRATAGKIVIGREEIDRYGDGTLGEVLRRLPGVTTPGAPGRGGPPRLRGLGSGYTQLLIDGQRLPAGFSLESLTPEQVERIEILRAPTAETGARAIAGTINIVLREGHSRRLNDVRLGLGFENGEPSESLNWTHDDTAGPLNYNLSGSAFDHRRAGSRRTETRLEDLDAGSVLTDRSETSTSSDDRQGLNLSSRLRWRLGEGEQLTLSPSLFHAESQGQRQSVLTERVAAEPLYDTASSDLASRYTTGRLNGQWRQGLGASRLELNGGFAGWRSFSQTLREELGGAVSPRRVEDTRETGERSGSFSGKLTRCRAASTAWWRAPNSKPPVATRHAP